jgi:2-desacetyl-2-hydroxyethyl bacteriochlorophyllide A dehydrogenase
LRKKIKNNLQGEIVTLVLLIIKFQNARGGAGGVIASQMLCAACPAPGRLELVPKPLPTVAPPGWVLVDIAAAGLCGTDYHIFQGAHPYLAYPRVIGHELSGHVAAPACGWEKGALVVINPYVACGNCRACRRGKPNCCTRIEVFGVHRDGGLCARIAVPAGNLYATDGLGPEAAAMVEFLAIGAHAVRRSGLVAGDRVLVTGAGPIGLGAALFARLGGATVHLLDTSPARLQAAGDGFGFVHLHGTGAPLLTGDLAEGFDIVFDATGNAQAIEAGFAHVAHGGSYVLISVVQGSISFADPEFHKREMRLIGARNATEEDFRTVMAAFASGDLNPESLVSERLRLADLPRRLPELAADRAALIKALVVMEAAP